MHVGIDIDGTIAGRNMTAFAAACDQQFCLDLPAQPSLTYKALMAHPVMQAQQRDAPERFEETLTRLELAPEMLRVLPPLPGAVHGVQLLSTAGSIGYYTVRKALPPTSCFEVETATRAWLAEHAFPAAQQVSFCWSLMNKLLHVYQIVALVSSRLFHTRILQDHESYATLLIKKVVY